MEVPREGGLPLYGGQKRRWWCTDGTDVWRNGDNRFRLAIGGVLQRQSQSAWRKRLSTVGIRKVVVRQESANRMQISPALYLGKKSGITHSTYAMPRHQWSQEASKIVTALCSNGPIERSIIYFNLEDHM